MQAPVVMSPACVTLGTFISLLPTRRLRGAVFESELVDCGLSGAWACQRSVQLRTRPSTRCHSLGFATLCPKLSTLGLPPTGTAIA